MKNVFRILLNPSPVLQLPRAEYIFIIYGKTTQRPSFHLQVLLDIYNSTELQ